jgi:Trk K+ transport system NAD-binding subunit
MLDRIVIVGAGRTAPSLVERLTQIAPVLVMDVAPEAIDELRAAMAPDDAAPFPAELRLGDGTSRFVLEEARDDPRHRVALVVATGDDRKNLEVCKLARELGYRPIVGIVVDRERASEYEALGAIAVVRATILGQVVDRALRYDGLTVATTVGQGKGEIIEFVVLPGSPAIGVPLTKLHADGWRLAAIYREGELVIPTGKTRILADDRIIIVGDPAMLPSVAEQLRIGRPTFPLRHGRNVVTYLPGGRDRTIEMEAEVLAIKTMASSLIRLYPGATPAKTLLEDEDAPPASLASHQRIKCFEDIPLDRGELPAQVLQMRGLRAGLVVTRARPRTLGDRLLGRGGKTAALCNALSAPVLFPKGAPHYTRVVHASILGIADMTVADMAIDLARMLSLPLAVARVTLPEYIGTRDREADQLFGEIERRALLYGLRAEIMDLEGNPITELLRVAEPSDLFVVGRKRTLRDSLTSPDIALRIAASAVCSILVHTYEEA